MSSSFEDAFFLTEGRKFEYGLSAYSKWLVALVMGLFSGMTTRQVATDMLAELFCEYYYCYGYFRRSVQR
jgi:hypothetical protein